MLPALRLYLIAGLSLLVLGGSSAEGQVAVPTATLTVNGTEQQPGGNWDAGNIQVDFNGYVEIVNYAEYSTNVSLASALAAMFVRDYHSFGLYAKAGANGTAASVITFQLVNSGTFGPLNVVDPSVSFTLSGSGFASSSATTADIGTATLNVNGSTVSTANYGDGSTGVSVAESLAQNANSPLVAVTSDGPNLYLQVKGVTGSYSYPYTLTYSTNLSFSNASGTLSSSTEVSPIAVYSYCIGPVDPCPSSGGTSGYLGNSNIQSINDSVMGSWTYGYDSLSRIKSGVASSGPYASASTCWSYDSFGNRTSQSVSSAACGSTPPSTFAAQYSSLNQISLVTTPTSTTVNYDKAGNVTGDGVNTYTYDAEGRVCALNGPQGMIGYQYDASGNRIGKGTVTNFLSCDITANGYSPMTDYVLDQSGSQMTEMAISTSASGTTASWIHSNVSADGSLIASYDNNPNATGGVLGGTSIAYGLHFYLNDALGSRRVQTDATGIPEQICRNLPFGDQLYCTGSLTSPTENLFTGKERDSESGLDYFGARYLSSNMGRFMSPDWSAQAEPVPYAKLDDPQSLNLYAYMGNNPLGGTDPDGHCGNSNSTPDWMCQNGNAGLANAAYGASEIGNIAGQQSTGKLAQQQNGQGQAAAPAGSEPESVGSKIFNQPFVYNSLYYTGTFASGAADFMTFGLTKKVNEMDGGASSIGYDSGVYTAGKVTGIGLTIATAAAGGATGAALADGKAGANFGRGTATAFNGRPGGAFIRFGWGWNQNLAGGAGRDIIRLGIGAARGTSWWSHITFWIVR